MTVLGCTEPRLWTPPLRELTPETSFGFDVVDFARDDLGQPLDPWQEWAVIHAGELLEDGRPRFRKVVILVARQNGKTEIAVVLTLYWLFRVKVPMILGTSTKLEYAAESWLKAVRLAKRVPELREQIPDKGGIRRVNGEQHLWRATEAEKDAEEGSRYKIAAANEEGGRSLTISRLILDELRQHHDYSAYSASVPAMNAVSDGQVIALSNAGTDRSVVLNDLRSAALSFIETGEGDSRLGLFEWSAEPGASPLDVEQLAKANPNLGRRIELESLLGDAQTAVDRGGDALAAFKVENLCLWVPKLDPAVDPEAWAECSDPGDLEALRDRVALCVDVSLDGEHATLVAAAKLPDGRVRVEPVAAWDSTKDLRRELPTLVKRIKPQALGWFPSGPAAAIAADLVEHEGWPPEGVDVEAIRRDVTACCMGFSDLVTSGHVAHSDDPLLTQHVEAAERYWTGDGWRFTRRGGHVDAAYAAAGATHLARTLPEPEKPQPKSVIV